MKQVQGIFDTIEKMTGFLNLLFGMKSYLDIIAYPISPNCWQRDAQPLTYIGKHIDHVWDCLDKIEKMTGL